MKYKYLSGSSIWWDIGEIYDVVHDWRPQFDWTRIETNLMEKGNGVVIFGIEEDDRWEKVV